MPHEPIAFNPLSVECQEQAFEEALAAAGDVARRTCGTPDEAAAAVVLAFERVVREWRAATARLVELPPVQP